MPYELLTADDKIDALKSIFDANQGKPMFNLGRHSASVVKSIQESMKTAAEYTVRNRETIEAQHAHSKGKLEELETLLKKKDFGAADLKQCETFVKIIKKNADTANQDTQDMAAALVPQYRANGWLDTAVLMLDEPSKGIIAEAKNQRAKEIAANKDVIALAKRCREYVVRAEELYKLAKVQADEMDTAQELRDDVGGLMDKLRDIHNKSVESQTHNVEERAGKLAELVKKKAISAGELKVAQGYIQDIRNHLKTARGAVKTMEALHDGMDKRGKSLNATLHKSLFAPALKEASEFIKPLRKTVDGLEKVEKKAEKDFKEVEKKAK